MARLIPGQIHEPTMIFLSIQPAINFLVQKQAEHGRLEFHW
jgi:hypothetical protein